MRTGTVPLNITHPQLIKEWHHDNPPMNTTSKGSDVKFKWVCANTHVWLATPNNRTKAGCPFCAGKRAIVGVNDLTVAYPAIASQWSKKNVKQANEYLPMSGQKVWWECEFNHEWQSTISNRTRGGNGCPYCSVGSVPRIEIMLLCSLSRYGEVRHHEVIGKHTVDILLPAKNAVIEYDGKHWRDNRKDQDTAKTFALLNSGYNVIRFRETGLFNLSIEHPRFYQFPLTWVAGQFPLNVSVDEALRFIDLFQV